MKSSKAHVHVTIHPVIKLLERIVSTKEITEHFVWVAMECVAFSPRSRLNGTYMEYNLLNYNLLLFTYIYTIFFIKIYIKENTHKI